MGSNVEEIRRQMLDLLAVTRRTTRSLFTGLDPDRVVHNDERAWRVRDILGHLGVWNGEAARSLSAYAGGGEYFCITRETTYHEYNGPAADERSTWPMERVWAEYDDSHDRLQRLVETLPAEKWDGKMLFPWSERGTVEQFIKRMMKHETLDHCSLVGKGTAN